MAQPHALSRVARKQREFVLLFGGMYLVNIILRISVETIAQLAEPTMALVAALISMGFSLSILVMVIVVMVQLMVALGYGLFARIAFVPLMIIPLVNILILLAVNGRATRTLQNAGVKVGFLGPSPATIAELETREAGLPQSP